MPTPMLQKISSKTGISMDDLEVRWERIKGDLQKEGYGEKNRAFYSSLVGRLKRTLSSGDLYKLGWSLKKKHESLASLVEQRALQLLPPSYYKGENHTGFRGPTIDLSPDEYWYHNGYQEEPEYSEKDHLHSLAHEFEEQNPTLLRQLKSAMSNKEYGFLLKQLAKGAFWGAALFANPIVISSGIALQQLYRAGERQKRKEEFIRDNPYPF